MAADPEPVEQVRLAVAAGRFSDIAVLCDALELEAAADGRLASFASVYVLQLAGHLLNNDLNAARFLWKRIPSAQKQKDKELAAVWRVGQAMWLHQPAAVHAALKAGEWSVHVQPLISALAESYSSKVFALLCQSYSSISASDAASLLGLSKEQAISTLQERGWQYDSASDTFAVVCKVAEADTQKETGQLHKLTEYVFHLE